MRSLIREALLVNEISDVSAGRAPLPLADPEQLMGTSEGVGLPNGDSLDLHQREQGFSTLIAFSSNESGLI